MIQMISCETEAEYERLWNEFNREIMEEPLIPKRFAVKSSMKFVMNQNLCQVWLKFKSNLGMCVVGHFFDCKSVINVPLFL
jgi:hypothetical protein